MSSLLHGITIGNVRLPSNLFLAPLAGYTDKVYRSICLSHGAALAYTEMVSSEGVARGNDKTVMLMERGEGEKNLAVQLFAPDADTVKHLVGLGLNVNAKNISGETPAAMAARWQRPQAAELLR